MYTRARGEGEQIHINALTQNALRGTGSVMEGLEQGLRAAHVRSLLEFENWRQSELPSLETQLTCFFTQVPLAAAWMQLKTKGDPCVRAQRIRDMLATAFWRGGNTTDHINAWLRALYGRELDSVKV